MPADIALTFDPVARRLDLALAGGNLVLDQTPVSALLAALLCDRRARRDDDIEAASDPALPPLLDPKRGWWADFMDPLGEALGSRLWLLARAKKSEAVRRFAETAAVEALGPIEAARGLSISVAARWLDAPGGNTPGAGGRLGLLVREGAASMTVPVVTL